MSKILKEIADKNINFIYLLKGDTYLFLLKPLLSCHPFAYHRNNDLTVFLSLDVFLTRLKESVETVIPFVCFKEDCVGSQMKNPLTHDIRICKHSYWIYLLYRGHSLHSGRCHFKLLKPNKWNGKEVMLTFLLIIGCLFYEIVKWKTCSIVTFFYNFWLLRIPLRDLVTKGGKKHTWLEIRGTMC